MMAPAQEALKLQRPLPDGALKIVMTGEKEDPAARCDAMRLATKKPDALRSAPGPSLGYSGMSSAHPRGHIGPGSWRERNGAVSRCTIDCAMHNGNL
jgi:hypothetical protein